MLWLALASIAFVGTHVVLAQWLRTGFVRSLGENGFAAFYVLFALATFGLMIWSYRPLGRQLPVWTAGDAVWLIASLLMWFAAILLVGSFQGNPAFPRHPGSGEAVTIRPAHGVFTITRHPMNWSFAIWAVVHALVVATPKAFILDAAIFVLAVGGSALQDRKKAVQIGDGWREWEAHTAFVPFARGAGNPGAVALIGGTLVFFLATWLHPIPAGFWRWIG